MRQLPNELACSVFQRLSLADRISATHVCKRWRNIALGNGQLWSSILCCEASILAALLERTRSVPVDMQVTEISLSNFEPVLAIVAAHLDHIRLLALHAGEAKLALDRVPTVHRALARAAPLLEVVDIQLFDQPFPGNFPEEIQAAHIARGPCLVPAGSFLHLAPKLRQLSFRTMTLPDAAAVTFSSVTTLDIDAVYLSAAQMSALVSLPCLRILRFKAVECELPRAPAPSGFKLDALWFDPLYATHWEDPICPVMRYLGFPRIRHFTTDWQVLWDALMSPPRALPHTLFVEHWNFLEGRSDSQAWRMTDGAGFVSDLLDVYTRDHFSWPPGQRVLANLRELVIVYCELRMAGGYDFAFRNLASLCVRVSAADFARSDWPETAGLPAPQLRTLELWGGMEESRVTMRAADVVGFVRDFLSLDRAHPPELVLRDVGIAHSAEELAQLEELVAGIRRSEGPAPESFVVELKSKWHASVRP